MNYGFIKVASASPKLKVGNCDFNAKKIIENIEDAYKKKAKIIVFPELAITGYSCGDLILNSQLLENSEKALKHIIETTKSLNIIIVVGAPIEHKNKLYNSGVCIYRGKILGIVPKENLPNYKEFFEKRYFNKLEKNTFLSFDFHEENIPFGKIIFNIKNIKYFKFAIEICEDLWAINTPSNSYTPNGATIILNLSASNEYIQKNIYRKELIKVQSKKCCCGYIYSNASCLESTTDLIFSGASLIYENGVLLKESEKFKNEIIYSEIDIQLLNNARRKNTSFENTTTENIIEVKQEFKLDTKEKIHEISRNIPQNPFILDEKNIDTICEEILDLQAYGLKKRLEHIKTKNVIIGVSGGLDSTLALLVINKAYELLNLDKNGIIAITMPCFGTSDRTLKNAKELCKELKTTLLEINIKQSVLKHFEDIGQDKNKLDVTYENSQARERTQVLMDMANKYGGIVIGTGDLSELALGFATYNGDHMSMYGVNASIPKTLIKNILETYAKNINNNKIKDIILDIINTPISPELLPQNTSGEISQITEEIVGPYELHDFFLYHTLENNFNFEKIYYMAKISFKNKYTEETIKKWLKIFYKRFFSQQFKRSCMPDSVKVTEISLSPRGDLKIPSDICQEEFIKNIEQI